MELHVRILLARDANHDAWFGQLDDLVTLSESQMVPDDVRAGAQLPAGKCRLDKLGARGQNNGDHVVAAHIEIGVRPGEPSGAMVKIREGQVRRAVLIIRAADRNGWSIFFP